MPIPALKNAYAAIGAAAEDHDRLVSVVSRARAAEQKAQLALIHATHSLTISKAELAKAEKAVAAAEKVIEAACIKACAIHDSSRRPWFGCGRQCSRKTK